MSTKEDREAAFIGKITAGATHELRNVLAIIKESAGLIADILNTSKQPASPQTEKLLRPVDRIEAQVIRGSQLLTSLNRFAHSMDHAEEEIDLDDAAQQVSFLCQRAAKQGGQSVQAHSGDQGLTVVANSLRLVMALYTAAECCMEQLPEGGTLKLHPVLHGNRPSVEFNGEVEGEVVSMTPTEAAAWNTLIPVLGDLDALVEEVAGARGFRFVFLG